MKEIHHEIGARVRFDDSPIGTVVDRYDTDRLKSDNYRVSWDGGGISTHWGSDLIPAEALNVRVPLGEPGWTLFAHVAGGEGAEETLINAFGEIAANLRTSLILARRFR